MNFRYFNSKAIFLFWLFYFLNQINLNPNDYQVKMCWIKVDEYLNGMCPLKETNPLIFIYLLYLVLIPYPQIIELVSDNCEKITSKSLRHWVSEKIDSWYQGFSIREKNATVALDELANKVAIYKYNIPEILIIADFFQMLLFLLETYKVLEAERWEHLLGCQFDSDFILVLFLNLYFINW